MQLGTLLIQHFGLERQLWLAQLSPHLSLQSLILGLARVKSLVLLASDKGRLLLIFVSHLEALHKLALTALPLSTCVTDRLDVMLTVAKLGTRVTHVKDSGPRVVGQALQELGTGMASVSKVILYREAHRVHRLHQSEVLSAN